VACRRANRYLSGLDHHIAVEIAVPHLATGSRRKTAHGCPCCRLPLIGWGPAWLMFRYPSASTSSVLPAAMSAQEPPLDLAGRHTLRTGMRPSSGPLRAEVGVRTFCKARVSTCKHQSRNAEVCLLLQHVCKQPRSRQQARTRSSHWGEHPSPCGATGIAQTVACPNKPHSLHKRHSAQPPLPSLSGKCMGVQRS
jgi:hypothetical protein